MNTNTNVQIVQSIGISTIISINF